MSTPAHAKYTSISHSILKEHLHTLLSAGLQFPADPSSQSPSSQNAASQSAASQSAAPSSSPSPSSSSSSQSQSQSRSQIASSQIALAESQFASSQLSAIKLSDRGLTDKQRVGHLLSLLKMEVSASLIRIEAFDEAIEGMRREYEEVLGEAREERRRRIVAEHKLAEIADAGSRGPVLRSPSVSMSSEEPVTPVKRRALDFKMRARTAPRKMFRPKKSGSSSTETLLSSDSFVASVSSSHETLVAAREFRSPRRRRRRASAVPVSSPTIEKDVSSRGSRGSGRINVDALVTPARRRKRRSRRQT